HIINAVKKHKIVDYERFMVIAIDALGNGVSISPSNYNGEMPVFSIEDMVHSQYKMLSEVLGIDNIYAIVGGSMGSFQTFQWLVSYPDFVEKAVPYVCSPVRTSSDKLWLNLEKDIILVQDAHDVPRGETQRIINLLTAYIAKTQNHLSREVDTDAFSEYYNNFTAVESKPFTLDNRLSQINAMLQHDITREFDHSLEKAAQAVKADLLIIVSDSDQIVNPQPALEFAELTGAELLILSNECGHLAPSCDMEKFTAAIQEFLKQ
ncbi:MAG: alpha/beta fold hydrolase, partial [Fidelibacterota bacterium]